MIHVVDYYPAYTRHAVPDGLYGLKEISIKNQYD